MRQKGNHKMIDLNLYISIITLCEPVNGLTTYYQVNGLNTPIKGRDNQIG